MKNRILLWLYVFAILGAVLFYSTQIYGMYLRTQFESVERVAFPANR